MARRRSKSCCLFLRKDSMTLIIHPSRSGDPSYGIYEALNDLLMKYNEEHSGVVLAYSDVILPNSNAKILDGLNPYFRVSLTANFLLFSPNIGDIIEGVVHKTGSDYISLHVLGVFNAAVSGTDLLELFESSEDWVNPVHYSKVDKSHIVKVGTKLRVSITRVRVEVDGQIAIDASLKVPGTGAVDWLERQTPNKTPEKKKHKKLKV